jgi:hypothetical protein
MPVIEAFSHCAKGAMQVDNEDIEADVAAFAALLSKEGNKGCRRYRLERKDGRLVLIRDELDRMFESVMTEVCGVEFDPDDKDGRFLD